MMINMSDLMPISLCLATQELFDSSRFRRNFCDYSVLRSSDKSTADFIWPMKRDMNSSENVSKFLEGHKAVIASNIDKVLSLVSSRYTNTDIRLVGEVMKHGRELIKKVAVAHSFEEIASMEPIFKSKITLPVYSLFNQYMKKSAA